MTQPTSDDTGSNVWRRRVDCLGASVSPKDFLDISRFETPSNTIDSG